MGLRSWLAARPDAASVPAGAPPGFAALDAAGATAAAGLAGQDLPAVRGGGRINPFLTAPSLAWRPGE